METTVEKMSVNIPKSDVQFFKELAKKMGWETESHKSFLDSYLNSRPKNVDLTEEEIMEEVRAVRYGKV